MKTYYRIELLTVGCSAFMATGDAERITHWPAGAHSDAAWMGHNWSASASEYNSDLRNTVVVWDDGRVYISNEIASGLGLKPEHYTRAYLGAGRRKLYALTVEALVDGLESAAYERRSDRERGVQTRDTQVINWLADIVG